MLSFDLLAPSRGRPDRVFKMVESAFRTANHPERVHVTLRFDADDKTVPESMKKLSTLGNINLGAHTGERIPILSNMWNEIWKMAGHDICWHGNDDMVFVTQGWDDRIAAIFETSPDMIEMVYCDDGYQHEKIAIDSFTSRKATEIWGYFLPPFFKALGNDPWITEVYRAIGRAHYLGDVLIRHDHWCISPENMKFKDEVYDHRAQFNSEADALYHSEVMKDRRREDAEKLRAVIRVSGGTCA